MHCKAGHSIFAWRNLPSTMQITQKSAEGLTREYSVNIPASMLETVVHQELVAYGKKVKLPGFRPGKVPMPVLQQKYRGAVLADALDRQVNQAIQQTVKDNNLRPAVQPKVKLDNYEDGKDLQVSLTFENLPEFSLIDHSQIHIERLVVEPDADAQTKAMDNLLDSQADLKPVADGVAAAMGHVVTVDFAGTVNGVAREGMQGTDMQITLGKGQLIPGFEEQLVGAKKGDQRTVNVTFPENYGAKDLAGQPAVFEVTIKEISERILPVGDDDFAKKLGQENFAQLQERIKDNIGAEYKNQSRQLQKRALFDALEEKLNFELPPSMLAAETKHIQQHLASEGTDIGARATELATRRVRLGLYIAELAKAENLSLSEDETRQALFQAAFQYGQQARQFLDYVRQNPQAMEGIKAPALEEKVVDWLLDKAKITEKPVTAAELEAAMEVAFADEVDLPDHSAAAHHAHDHDDPNHVHDEHCGHAH